MATTVVLLSRKARARALTGRLRRRGPGGELTVSFRYRVIRLWERPVDELLMGGLGLLPMAPLAALQPGQLPEVLHLLDVRFEREAAAQSDVDDLWAATLMLMGLRYDRRTIRALGERVRRMHESVTYQMIIEEGIEKGLERGRAEGLVQGEIIATRRVLVHLATQRFGSPDEQIIRRLESVGDLATLERASDGILTATSWDDLLVLAGA